MLARQNQPQTIVAHFRRALDLYEKMTTIDAERMQVKILAAARANEFRQRINLKRRLFRRLDYLRKAIEFYKAAGAANTIDAHLKRHFAEARASLAEGAN
jgi:hypothetical protein